MGATIDREELIALIHANRIAVWTKDYQAWTECWVHEPYAVRWGYWSGGGTFVRRGWDDISARAVETFTSNDLPYDEDNAFRTKVENLSLQIRGDMAWAVYDQHHPKANFKGHMGPGITRELRIFERYDGRWKIVLLGFMDSNSVSGGTAVLTLDAEGKVQWLSPEAERRLADDDDLVIRNQRLRARNASADRKVQAALQWAAGVDSGYTSNGDAMPVVMAAGEGLPNRVWWVVVQNGVIYFVLDGQSMTAERLDFAATIFSLSAVQRRLAGYIADGHSLPETAVAMGITANTARTHLQRIFEKTGVHSQTALVRVLLSVGVPFRG